MSVAGEECRDLRLGRIRDGLIESRGLVRCDIPREGSEVGVELPDLLGGVAPQEGFRAVLSGETQAVPQP